MFLEKVMLLYSDYLEFSIRDNAAYSLMNFFCLPEFGRGFNFFESLYIIYRSNLFIKYNFRNLGYFKTYGFTIKTKSGKILSQKQYVFG